jgi:hypothetical protein
MHRRRLSWLALVGIGLAGVVAVSAATTPARDSASAFELTLDGTRTETLIAQECPDCPSGFSTTQGTFRSQAPFCETGTFTDAGGGFGRMHRVFTCDDGSGSLTVSLPELEAFLRVPSPPTWNGTWWILEGSGNYADLRLVTEAPGMLGLRGEGVLRGEVLSDEPVTWRSTLEGVAAHDAVAPTITLSSATPTKLRRPAGAYSIKLALALRDNVEENPVSYRVRVSARGKGGQLLAERYGTARTGAVSLRLRVVVPSAKVKAIRLEVAASDPVGNTISLRRAVTLPQ